MRGHDEQGGTQPHIPAADGDTEAGQLLAAQPPLATVSAHTFVCRWTTASDPAALRCDDGETYVVKASHPGRPEVSRMMIADHVVGRLGELLEAPVPSVALVEVPAPLIAAQPEMSGWSSGVAHGSRFIENTTEREGLSFVDAPANRERFARLAILFGWTQGSDQQFIYEKTVHLVYSHDHGHFFPGGPQWTEASLLAALHNAQTDQALVQGCNLNAQEIAAAVARLQATTVQQIEVVVTGVPAVWGITAGERTALREFLVQRRASLTGQPGLPP